MSKKMLSIVIPCHNKLAFTSSALKDLSYLDPDMHQLVVVDNGSTDDTQKAMGELRKQLRNLTYLRLDKNTGFGFACNRGYKESTTPYVMFLNNDIRVSSHLPTWTDTYISELNENPKRLLSPTGGYIDPKRDFQFCYETSGDKKFNYLSGWMLVSSKDTFEKFKEGDNEGPFRADKYVAYYEDTHIGFQAAKLGVEMSIVPNNSVSHFGRVTSKALNTSKMYNESRKTFMEIWSK